MSGCLTGKLFGTNTTFSWVEGKKILRFLRLEREILRFWGNLHIWEKVITFRKTCEVCQAFGQRDETWPSPHHVGIDIQKKANSFINNPTMGLKRVKRAWIIIAIYAKISFQSVCWVNNEQIDKNIFAVIILLKKIC